MTARLPIPGSDDGSWGDILNTYLSVAHKTDGSLQDNSVGTNTIQSGAITSGGLANGSVTANKLSASGGSDGQILSYSSSVSGHLAWAAAPTGGGSSTLAGDTDVNITSPSNGQLLTYDSSSSKWKNLGAPVSSVAGKTGVVTLAKGDVGLGNVDNTADVDKPVSTATQTALNAKVDTFTTVNGHALSANVTVSQSDVGLGNVDNTSDLSKPISTATQTALDAKASDSTVVHNSGAETVAGIKTFSSSPIVPTPGSGTDAANKTYVDTAVAGAGGSSTLAGDTDVSITTPANGQVLTYSSTDTKWENLDLPTAPVTSVSGKTGDVTLVKSDVGLSNVDNTSDLSKPISTAAQAALDAKVDSTTTVNGQALSADVTLTKSDVGLGNVDNTSDVDKPISTATQAALDTKYAKPAGGIPKTDLEAAVQTSLNTADARDAIALQGTGVDSSTPSDGQVLVYSQTSGTWVPNTVSQTTVSDATTTSKGIVQLAGDLGGSGTAASAPKVSGIQGITVSTTAPTNGQVLTATSTSAAAWQDSPSAPVTSVAGKTGDVTLVKGDVGLGNVDNTSDLSKPISTATQTALNAKVDDTTTVNGHALSADVTLTKSDVGLGNVDNTSDATKNAAAVALINKDLTSNTNTFPTLNQDTTGKSAKTDAINSATTTINVSAATAPTTGQVLTATDGTHATWQNVPAATAPAWGSITGTLSNQTDLQTALNAKANNSTTVTGSKSISGGGDLSANRTLSLVNDAATPGNSQYYGTDGTGTKGYFALPSGGSGTLAGDTDVSITTPANNQVLTYNSTDSKWENQTALVTSVAGKTGAVTLSKSDVSLANVDNTSDLNKPISTATQTALNAKANTSSLATVATTGSYTDLINQPTITKVTVSSTAPSSPSAGDVWIDTSS